MRKSSPAIPFKALALLVAAVLLAHLLVLRGTSVDWRNNKAPLSRPFTTRLIELKPPAPPADVKPVALRPPPTMKKAAPAPIPKPRTPPVLEQNQLTARPEHALPAIESAAEAMPAPTAEPARATPPAETLASEPAAAESAPPPPSAPKDTFVAQAYVIPDPMRLTYNISGQIKKFSYSAGAELLWRHDSNSYDARLEVSAFLLGSRVQTSTGRLTAQGLAPTRFSDKARSELAAHFERDKGRIIFSANTPQAPLVEGAQDRLSVFIQLGAMLAGDPLRFPPGTTISLPTVGTRDADTWVFDIGPEEKLELPGGELMARKLTRQPRQDYDQKVELWLAPALGYLPARIRLTQTNGDFIDQQWRASETP